MTACRGCGGGPLTTVLSLGEQPLANAFLREEDLDRPEPRYPLGLAMCPECCLVQLTDTVPPELLFRDYPYFSSVSDTFVAQAGALADRMIRERDLGPDSLVVEIASNDGYLLQHYVRRGIPVLGIDPARNVAAAAVERGVPTIPEFFGQSLAQELRRSGKAADVVHANNVLAHVPDIHDVLSGLATILKPEGVLVIETPYVRDLVDRLEFDTIYHEHVFYYSLTALARLLGQHGLVVADVERSPVHGGSLRLFVMPSAASEQGTSVRAMLDVESSLGINDPGYFDDFANSVTALGPALQSVLHDFRSAGQRVAAYGAAAKGTVLLNAFGIGRDAIDFVADRSPHKQGMYMPGVHIPIVPAERLDEAMPDACLLLAWNFRDEILAQQADYRRQGGRFILPIPSPTVV